jgi:beta-xylosidase
MKQKNRLVLVFIGVAVLAGVLIVVLILFLKGCDLDENDAIGNNEPQKEDNPITAVKEPKKTAAVEEKKVTTAVEEKKKITEAVASKGEFFDDFNDPVINKRWFWVREKTSQWSLKERPGFLSIVADNGDLFGGFNNNRNMLLLKADSPDFQVDTKLVIRPISDFHQAGIVVYSDDGNYAKLVRIYSRGDKIELLTETGGYGQSNPLQGYYTNSNVYLRLVKKGNKYAGFYSENGTDFLPVGTASLNLGVELKVGLIAFNTNASSSVTAYFDFFHIVF